MLANNGEGSILVLFSGGQDSATVLAWACENYAHVQTVGFHYGQRHDVEMSMRITIRKEIKKNFPRWRDRLGPDHLLHMGDFGKIAHTAMTENTSIKEDKNGLPNTFVPGRNLAFLVYASALSHQLEIDDLGAGMCETDFSGYPDCRADTLNRQMEAINLGMFGDALNNRILKLHTPLMAMSKKECWLLANDLGGEKLVELIRVHSHSCYIGERGECHDWGYGCGNCPACQLRKKGWREYIAA